MTHKHRVSTARLGPFQGPARGAVIEEPRAHGNVTDVQRCACGATREVNFNQGFMEVGTWSDPPTPNESEAT